MPQRRKVLDEEVSRSLGVGYNKKKDHFVMRNSERRFSILARRGAHQPEVLYGIIDVKGFLSEK